MTVKRLRNIQRFSSAEVMGEGSWVRCRQLTVAEMRDARKETGVKDSDLFELGVGILKTHILEWNWVDDEGAPLPQVPEHPEVVDRLVDPEIDFLSGCIRGSQELAKN